MFNRAVVTGIPNYQTNFVERAEGVNVRHRSSLRPPATKGSVESAVRAIGNTGNYFIGEGALDAIDCPATTQMPFWHFQNNLDNPGFYDEINRAFDVFVFTAANLIRSDFSAEMEAKVLERIKIPIVIVGIGLQRRADLNSDLPAGTHEFVRLLAERNAVVLTRGHETADYLKECGVVQARPTGCPSIYHLSSNTRKAWSTCANFRVTEDCKLVFSGYLGHETGLGTPSDVNALVSASNCAYYVLQDEFIHWKMRIEADDNDIVRDPASGAIVVPLTFQCRDEIKPALEQHLFFDPIQWRAWMSGMQFGLHRRFHGSIGSLQAGVPSIMIAIDDRMREMLHFVGFPYIERADWVRQTDKKGYLNGVLEALNTSETLDRYREAERTFRTALFEAGLAHASI